MHTIIEFNFLPHKLQTFLLFLHHLLPMQTNKKDFIDLDFKIEISSQIIASTSDLLFNQRTSTAFKISVSRCR